MQTYLHDFWALVRKYTLQRYLLPVVFLVPKPLLSASTEDLAKNDGVFKEETLAAEAEYASSIVNADGWEWHAE